MEIEKTDAKTTESKHTADHVNHFLQQRSDVAKKLADREEVFNLGSDAFACITEFLSKKDLYCLSLVCRSWLGCVHELRDFIRNQICIVLDNTVSMNKTRQKLQQEFLTNFLTHLNPCAIVAIRLVNSDVGKGWLDLIPKQGLARSLAQILPSLLVPEFYCAGSTPLFQSICNAVSEGFKIVLCLTDGFDTESKTTNDLVIFAQSFFDKFLESQGKTSGKAKKLTLVTFMQTLLQIVPANQVFLPALVGFDIGEEDSNALLPIYSLKSTDKIRMKADLIRQSVVPREAGGGRRTKAAVILQDSRYQNAPDKFKRFFRLGWLFFPEVSNMHCISILTAYRHLTLEDNITNPLWTRWIPLLTQAKETKTKGWYFRYAKAVYPIAVEELKKTRNAALAAFSSLDPLIFTQLIQESREYNWIRYEEYMKNRANKKSRKRKRANLNQEENKSMVDGTSSQALSKIDFEKIIGPYTTESSELIKKVPASCYPVSVPTYFWLVQKDVKKEICLDRILRQMEIDAQVISR